MLSERPSCRLPGNKFFFIADDCYHHYHHQQLRPDNRLDASRDRLLTVSRGSPFHRWASLNLRLSQNLLLCKAHPTSLQLQAPKEWL